MFVSRFLSLHEFTIRRNEHQQQCHFDAFKTVPGLVTGLPNQYGHKPILLGSPIRSWSRINCSAAALFAANLFGCNDLIAPNPRPANRALCGLTFVNNTRRGAPLSFNETQISAAPRRAHPNAKKICLLLMFTGRRAWETRSEILKTALDAEIFSLEIALRPGLGG